METTIPISITIVGHPLIQTVTMAWSASRGMVPQALLFPSEGGSAEAQLTCDHPESVMIHYRIQVNFAIPGWEIVELEQSISINAGGDRIVINPGSWIHYLSLGFQIADDTVNQTDRSTQIDAPIRSGNHLVVNLTWQTSHLSHPIKLSHQMQPNQIWQIPYLGITPQDQVSASISAFGIIDRRMARMAARSIQLMPDQVTSSNWTLVADKKGLKLVDSTN